MSKEVGRTSEQIANREGRRDSTPGDRLVTFPTLKLRLGGVGLRITKSATLEFEGVTPPAALPGVPAWA
jgi:hypothetical protein